MSHVASIECEINDLASLEKACNALGLELVRGQSTYKWYGTSVGDYPLPTGFSAKDLGKCEHAIRIPGDNRAYEIGVVKRRDGKNGFTLLWDFWQGGFGMEAKVGKDGYKLIQNYSIERAKKEIPSGFKIKQTTKSDGHILLEAVKYN